MILNLLKTVAAAATAMAIAGSAAHAAQSAMAKVCGPEIMKLCPDAKPGPERGKCVQSHLAEFSSPCQDALAKAAAVARACRADAKKFCGDVKPGQGARLECMKSHMADLSGACKSAVEKAEAGNM
jgi:hypothetical protein